MNREDGGSQCGDAEEGHGVAPEQGTRRGLLTSEVKNFTSDCGFARVAAVREIPQTSDARTSPATQPRPTNSGVVSARTSMGLDWVAASKPKSVIDLGELVARFGGSGGKEITRGHGFRGITVCNDTGELVWRELAEGQKDVLVVLKGRALEWLRDRGCDDVSILREFKERGFRINRCDPAIDTTDPEVNPKLVYDAWQDGHVVSRAKGMEPPMHPKIPKGGRRNEDGVGWTVYIGSKASTRYLRVYDKQYEVMKKTGNDPGHLTRFEFQIRDEAADKIADEIIRNGIGAIPSIFRGWIDFKKPSENKQVTRWEQADWWNRMIGDVSRITPKLARGIATPDTVAKTFPQQWGQNLALIVDEGRGAEWLAEVVRNGRTRVGDDRRQHWRERLRSRNPFVTEQVIETPFEPPEIAAGTQGAVSF